MASCYSRDKSAYEKKIEETGSAAESNFAIEGWLLSVESWFATIIPCDLARGRVKKKVAP